MSDAILQKDVAARLGLSDRRVRQLIASRILPEPGHEGLYDADECAVRYRLYTAGTDRDWSDFFDDLEADDKKLSALVEKATQPKASLDDIGMAGRAVLKLFGRLRFAMVVNEKSEATSALITRLLAIDEAAAMAPVFDAVDAFNTRHAAKGRKPVPIREQLTKAAHG